ncbi:hypothetical protein [Streptomyces sp. NPDC059080]|uniref:hypothetical protein n=1 Tax=Streptomyces sp. NPDC059080 TaxID=3346718 RepID=UPI0036AAD45E
MPIKSLPPVGGSIQPHFIFTRTEEGREHFAVHARLDHWTSDQLLGHVYETAGAGWVADWSKEKDRPQIAMPEFQSKEGAASALFWFQPPTVTDRCAEWYSPRDTWVNVAVKVRAETEDIAYKAIEENAMCVPGGEGLFETEETTYSLSIETTL